MLTQRFIRARRYGPPVDLWAAGLVLAQLFSVTPLIAGATDVDQLYRVLALLGTPTEDTWPGDAPPPHTSRLLLSIVRTSHATDALRSSTHT